MNKYRGIDLRGRMMLHPPWTAKRSNFHFSQKEMNPFPQPAVVIRKITQAFLDAGGSLKLLATYLNNHVPEDRYKLKPNELLESERKYSLEYYFYLVQFTKLLTGDENFRYVPHNQKQLPAEHRIIEQGTMHFPPWITEKKGGEKGYLSITNMTSMFAYVEDTAPIPFYNTQNHQDLRLNFSKEGLSFLNMCTASEYQVDRNFFDRERILISFEYLFYISCIFEILLNDDQFVCRSLYYGTMNNNNLARAIFLQPSLSPIDGFEQWQEKTNNVYNLKLHQRGKILRVGVSLQKPIQSGQFGMYLNNSIRGIKQAHLGIYKAFMELATHKPAKTAIFDRNSGPEEFEVRILWKDPYLSVNPAVLITGSGTVGMSFFLIAGKFLPTHYHASGMSLLAFVVIGAISSFALYWLNRLKAVEKRFGETKLVIDAQLESLKKSSNDLLLERNSLEKKVKKRTEELNTAMAELTALDRAKTNFITNVSHELRTPLTLLSVPLEGITDGRYGENLTSDHQVFSLMKRNVCRLQNQISQLLDFTRLDMDTIPFELQKISLLTYCRGLVKELQPLAEQKGLILSMTNETGRKDLVIEADVSLLETAVLNLLNNALKFTQEGSIQIILSLLAEEEKIKLTIKDTGIGFIPAEKERIFQRFTQAEEHKQKHHEGIGIGLALTRQIAQRHKGLMMVESSPGNGSAFSLVIRLLAEESQPLAASTPDNRKERVGTGLSLSTFCDEHVFSEEKNSILLVEDNPDMAAIFRSILEVHYNLHWCGSGQEALEYLNRNPPVELIICDVMMPGMNGFSFRESIMNRTSYKDTPFIFLTALADPREKVIGLQSGALDYIQKPFSSNELLLKIRNLLATCKASYQQALRDREGTERLIRLANTKNSSENHVQLESFGITLAEKRVLDLLRLGFQDKEIAAQLSLSPRTISSHLGNLYRKTRTQNRVELLNRIFTNM